MPRKAAVENVPGMLVAITAKECSVGTPLLIDSVVAVEEISGMNPLLHLCPEMFAVGQIPIFTIHVGMPDPV